MSYDWWLVNLNLDTQALTVYTELALKVKVYTLSRGENKPSPDCLLILVT